MNLFCSGIFIGGAFLHLLPESRADYVKVVGSSWIRNLPVTEAIAAVTCLCMVAIDHISSAHNEVGDHVHGPDGMAIYAGSHPESTASLATDPESGAVTAEGESDGYAMPEPRDGALLQSDPPMPTHRKHMHKHRRKHRFELGVTSLFLLAALSFHSCIEGFGLGVLDITDDRGDAIAFLIAIVSHKGFEVMALMAAILSHGTNVFTACILLGLFTLVTPVGLITGALLRLGTAGLAHGAVKDVVVVIGTAASAGTFTYVGVVEMLSDSIHKGTTSPLHAKAVQLSLITVGFLIMAAVLLLPEG
ncbi:metal cation tansorter, zinc [Carpediemonas membranifera]|uniref:Metal cation tansorter, zinc n=1 Tax=Carpediemonas membranifera TaxID=201153 RepID=A0A8J6BVB4_9EUKA|nr:metal cation tansorter, zinc [Carpediemonas membranifera]|eukprot:KAG9391251.1 metal cation tansorter, zinc [Carpediemonas membranifera]